jgi:hypothetical protein
MLNYYKDKIKEKLPEYIFKAIGVVIFPLAALIPYDRFDSQFLFWTLVIITAICFFLVGYITSQRPKDIWLPEIGLWQDKKTGNYICPSCKSKNIRSPLMETDRGWVCSIKDCKLKRYKPGKEPKIATGAAVVFDPGFRSSWINGWKR